MTLREQVAAFEALNLPELSARLAVLDLIANRADEEREAITRSYARGSYRDQLERASYMFWSDFWKYLRWHLEDESPDQARRLLDTALDRLEPRG